ncbi:RNA polymerase sigma factor [Salinibacterium sp. SYSU T00001]|uniref:RNA polymerase sigma factor n=1 Tax=Homoserinimonas sedimenticola TaxID=2986805 RepID=UPI002235708E|nr:RNA polymerase sigma factor [Salinibacterium sedimenticola]MCW4386355.1 RNA polymerase sigma factor [Salinibacterium sedimenticola]
MSHPFERVVQEHGATVLRVCRAVLGVQDADDAWSETFLAALRAYPSLPADADVAAWLVTIAHRKAIDVLRARARDPLPVAAVPETESSTGVPGADDSELWALVATLPPKQRQAVAYHFFAGLPHVEVASIMGVSADAARRASSDGVAALRTLRKKWSD